MDKKKSIAEIKEKKELILEKLSGYYEELFQLNCEQIKLECNFPENYKIRKFTLENENGKFLTFGKTNLKKGDLYHCEIWAYQLKRNGTYYTHPELISVGVLSKLKWSEIE
ncbi:MAG: hypothetical protein ACRCTS_00550 [Fusobacteriaceae bacterium]